MKFIYIISSDNFLEYYLYMVSESRTIKRKRNILQYSFSVIYLLFGIYFFTFEKYQAGIIFTGLCIGWYILYPKLNKKSLQRFYSNYLDKNYRDRMDTKTVMTIDPESILIIDGHSQNELTIPELEKAIETVNCFFLKLKSGTSFIIPKDQIDNLLFREEIEKLGIEIYQASIS